jgi:hypothetical protein
LYNIEKVGLYFFKFTFPFAKVISETIHWLFAIEYYTVVANFPVIILAADPNSNQDQIHAKAKRAVTMTKVLNIVFYSLVIACFILIECSVT